ncbi:MAG TPA: FHA domain-containing protein, partial [Burkholderiaceae bacterium]|nr:FHA domain-containing protein [Burkholderiaceae bacterium]
MKHAILQCSAPDGETREYAVHEELVNLGRGRQSLIEMQGWKVGREHARLSYGREGWTIEDLGTLSGTWVNGSRIVRYGPLTFADQIRIGSY